MEPGSLQGMPQILEIGPEDFTVYAEEILAIERVSFPTPWSYNAFKSETQKKVSNLWVLISDGILAGYICFWVMEREIQLINLAVHPEKRGNRFGRFLLTKMIEKGIDQGVNNIWLEVRPSNSWARNLYKKMGFFEIGRRPRYYYETNEDAIMMSLIIPRWGV